MMEHYNGDQIHCIYIGTHYESMIRLCFARKGAFLVSLEVSLNSLVRSDRSVRFVGLITLRKISIDL